MAPLFLVGAGIVALAAGWMVLRTYGGRFRVGRLLAATPRVTIAEAAAIARSGATRYIGVTGRIDSDEDFEDPNHRPLVLRRTRLEVRDGGRWRALVDDRRAVPFLVREGLDEIAVDAEAIREGLVVVPRVSVGTAAEVPEHIPGDLAPVTPVRLRLEQLSSVEHASVLGTPRLTGTGVVMTAGGGRPLIVTPLETSEAIRILGEGRGRPAAAGLLIAAGLVLAFGGLAWASLDAAL